MALQHSFEQICRELGWPNAAATALWTDIVTAHSGRNRHYHNLDHLEHLHAELMPVRTGIRNWNAALLAILYHDFVYHPLASDNEERSVRRARTALEARIDAATLSLCVQHILATKKHHYTEDPDTNLFTDADLAILGAPPDRYSSYAQAVRKEYRLVPDLIYGPGRKKVLQRFLDLPSIYKTSYFRERYEAQARENLRQEGGVS